MLNRIVLGTLVALGAFAARADEAPQDEYNYAQACTEPAPPAAIDGSKATQTEIDAGRGAVDRFISASDSYQNCLGRALGKQQNTAYYMHSNVPAHIVKQIEGKVTANQKQKEQVAAGYNAAVAAFHAKSGTP